MVKLITNSDKILNESKKFCNKAANHIVDLTEADNFSYSAIMREINKCCSDEQIEYFLKLYKGFFDESHNNGIQKPETVALQNALTEYGKTYKIQISSNLVKSATISELGSAEDIGHYIANVILFLMNKISDENRQSSINSLKTKILNLNPNSLSEKEMPNSAAIGQSITFVKNILFNHDPNFIRDVLKNVVEKL